MKFKNNLTVKISTKSDQWLPRYSDFVQNLSKIWQNLLFFQMQIAQNGRGLPPIYHKTKKYLKAMNFHGMPWNLAATPDQKNF